MQVDTASHPVLRSAAGSSPIYRQRSATLAIYRLADADGAGGGVASIELSMSTPAK